MPHSRSLSEQSCLLSNVDFSHEDGGDRSRRGLPYTFPSQHQVHDYHDPESALPLSPTPEETESIISWTDLPNKSQLLILSLCRVSSPLSNVLLLPYLFHLVRSAVSPPSGTPSLQVATDNDDDIVTYYTSIPTTAVVSTYSGVLVAAFPLAQLLVSFLLPWERHHGGKMPIVWSLAISAVANLAFGLSRSFWALLFWRTVSGLASGNEGLVRKMAGEKTFGEEKMYQGKACQVLSVVGNLGVVIGLAMGGLLAEPVKTMPGLFGGAEGVLNWSGSEEGVKWMVEYPFALPSVVNAVLIGIVAAVAAGWLREAMPRQDQAEDGTGHFTHRPYILLNNTSTLFPSHNHDDEKPAPKPPLFSALTTRTLPPLISSFLLTLHTSAFTFILPLHLSAPSSPFNPLLSNSSSHSLVPILFRFTGGLSLSPLIISLYLSFFGLLGLLFRGFVYPRWQKRLCSTMGLFELSLAVFPFVYLVTPYLSLFSWGHQDTTKGCAEIMRWIALGVVIGGQTLAKTMADPSAEVLLVESAPSKQGVRERVQEMGNIMRSLASVVGPVVGGVVYAKGVREGVVGAAWWFYLVVVAVAAAGWCVGVQGRVYEEREDEEKR
ncbi:major facilitator superfamily domain-containing protein [Neurospora tetraspora]|uniref:Major facilitator superfamily domain-containing protein n=1 Tax=Neurospora tetraspora TaxID=94610 RepID=A0AAE0MR24_9PEZI|nr:major facilitator superfamily domain-containing protein [Neurospora tetraspora]